MLCLDIRYCRIMVWLQVVEFTQRCLLGIRFGFLSRSFELGRDMNFGFESR